MRGTSGGTPPSARPVLVEARGLGKCYPTATGALTVLADLDVEIRAGEMVAVVGESGTGKSTLLHLLGTLDRPTEGTVRFRGEDVFARIGRGARGVPQPRPSASSSSSTTSCPSSRRSRTSRCRPSSRGPAGPRRARGRASC